MINLNTDIWATDFSTSTNLTTNLISDQIFYAMNIYALAAYSEDENGKTEVLVNPFLSIHKSEEAARIELTQKLPETDINNVKLIVKQI